MGLVQEQRQSGLTIRAWCASKSINESNYYYWLREIRKAALQTSEGRKREVEQALVRIELPSNANPTVGNVAALAIRLQYKCC